MRLETVQGDDVPKSHLPFSPALRVGDLVLVSGQASVDDSGTVVVGTFEEEMRRAMFNLQRVLRAAKTDLDSVVQVRAYVGCEDDLPEFNRIYSEYFTVPYPVRTTLVGCIGRLKFEIDVQAVA